MGGEVTMAQGGSWRAAHLVMALAAFAAGQSLQDPDHQALEAIQALMRTPVISANQVPQSQLRAPAKVVSLSAADLQARGYLDLEEVLHDLAGFDFARSFGVEWSTIYMRGFRSSNSDRFLLIWDGVVQNDLWKQSNWISRQYPLSRVRRIEIMYGPASLLYGANAMSGIINVILTPPSDSAVHLTVGPDRTRSLEATWGTAHHAWAWEIGARVFRADEGGFQDEAWTDRGGRRRGYGLRFPEDLASPGDPGYALVLQNGLPTYLFDGLRRSTDGRYTHPTRDWSLHIKARREGWTLQGDAWQNDEGQGQWYTALNKVQSPWSPYAGSFQIAHERTGSRGLRHRAFAQLRYSGIDGDRSWGLRFVSTFPETPGPTALKVIRMDSAVFSKLFNREWKAGYQVTLDRPHLQALLGTEFTAGNLAEDYAVRTTSALPWSGSPRHQPRNAALFGHMQRVLGARWEISLGSRYDYNFHAGEAGGFGSLLTSRLALLFAPGPIHRIKLLFGQGFQEPPPFQKWSTAPAIRDLPAPDLRPERLRSLELIYMLAPDRPWQVSLNAYLTRISDVIALRTGVPFGAGTTTQYHNVGGVRIQGLELEGRGRLPSGLGWFANATAARAEDAATGRKTGDIPALKGNLGLDGAWGPSFRASLRAHVVGPRDTVNWDSNSIHIVRRVAGYTSVDLTLRWVNLVPGLEMKLQALNLFSARYYDPGVRSADGKTYNAVLLQPPLRVFLGVGYRF